jgi:WXG100 family type VII secretion target
MAASQHTSAQTHAMAQAAFHVGNAHEAITGVKNQVAGTVAGTSAAYVSEAATLFRSVMEQWDQDFNTILAGLRTMGEKLTGTAHHYGGAMDHDHQSANQIAAALNGNGA